MKNTIKKTSLIELSQSLREQVNNAEDFFETTLVVFPNKRSVDWFVSDCLKNSNDVLMNIECKTIDEALMSLIRTEEKLSLINKRSFNHFVLKHLAKNIEELPEEIKKYIFKDNNEINNNNFYDLSIELSNVLTEYEKDRFEPKGWQKDIYDLAINDCKTKNLVTLSNAFKNKEGFNKKGEAVHFFGFNRYNKLQQAIIDAYSLEYDVYEYRVETKEQKKFPVIEAPSKIREIEAIHSDICKKIKEDKTLCFNDFLVIAPSVSEYENTICQVFKQDDKEFLSIPFCMRRKKGGSADLKTALETLFHIYKKGFYTRNDFCELASNRIVSTVKEITEEDIDNIKDVIIKTKTFRNNPLTNLDDWNYLKIRLLLSKLGDYTFPEENYIELNDPSPEKETRYTPYSGFAVDDSLIKKIVSLIDQINAFINAVSKSEHVDKNTINSVKEALDALFSIKDYNGIETNSLYKPVLKAIDSWNENNVSEGNISVDAFLFSLLDSAGDASTNIGSAFKTGVTFVDFDNDAIYTAKHVYFIGANSSALPKKQIFSELDERDRSQIESELQIERVAFNSLSNDPCSNFVVSYQNRDLKTDEELFPSVLLKEGAEEDHTIIEIDETRSWSEIFTKKGSKNKDFFGRLTKSSGEEKGKKTGEIEHQALPIRVYTSNLEKILREPLECKANNLFGSGRNNDDEIENEYEPLALNALDLSIILKELVAKLIEEDKKVLNDEDKEELKEELKMNHIVSEDDDVLDKAISDLCYGAEACVSVFTTEEVEEGLLVNLPDLSLETDDGYRWLLIAKNDFYRIIKDDGKTRIYYEIKQLKANKHGVPDTDYIRLYLLSLMDIALLNDEVEYTVVMKRTAKAVGKDFTIKSAEAKKLLNMCFKRFVNYEHNIFVPMDIIKKKKLTFNKLVETISSIDGNPWKNFKDAKLFDAFEDLGYTYFNFDVKKQEEYSALKELVKYFDTSSRKKKGA